MTAIFRFEQQQGHLDKSYEIETILPVGAAVICENSTWYRVDKVDWSAESKGRCLPVFHLSVHGQEMCDDW